VPSLGRRGPDERLAGYGWMMKSRLNRAAVRVFDIVDGEHVSIDSEQLTLLGPNRPRGERWMLGHRPVRTPALPIQLGSLTHIRR
jgi:hypothetical protein